MTHKPTDDRTVRRIISGGQIGADIAGLLAAKDLGLETGGWMTSDYRTLAGPRPDYAERYGIRTVASTGYPARTRMNVIESDATVRFAFAWGSPGERATLRELKKAGKPFFDVSAEIVGDDGDVGPVEFSRDPFDLRTWLDDLGVQVLNVAGNANETLTAPVRRFLVETLR